MFENPNSCQLIKIEAYLSKGGKRKETGNGVKEKEEGILRQLGEREKNLPR